ncbi:MAG: GNAT family N-acetyltransferase [Alphaproteobacteria bacterium]|nr:GNAT family N-acetyltransferase [Alphaproteobacteria bacterium]
MFCVAPKHRHKGEGRYLLSELIKLADRNKCKIFLEVADTNQIAQNLYLSLEFNPISIRKNYYKVADGYKDAIVMVRSVHNNTTK